MSRTRLLLIGLALACVTAAPAAASTALTGTWRSAPEETPLASDFDVSVWGPGAKAVRTVQLAIRPTREATLTITRKVVDRRGRTVKGSTSIEEAQLVVGDIVDTVAARSTLGVTVKAAERRYPDDPGSNWPLDGLKVVIATFNDDPAALEVRFDTPEGRGSFWETLRRARGTAVKPSAAPKAASSNES